MSLSIIIRATLKSLFTIYSIRISVHWSSFLSRMVHTFLFFDKNFWIVAWHCACSIEEIKLCFCPLMNVDYFSFFGLEVNKRGWTKTVNSVSWEAAQILTNFLIFKGTAHSLPCIYVIQGSAGGSAKVYTQNLCFLPLWFFLFCNFTLTFQWLLVALNLSFGQWNLKFSLRVLLALHSSNWSLPSIYNL